MNWKEEMLPFEEKLEWRSVVRVFERENTLDRELYYRVLFLLQYFLLEGRYSTEEHDEAATRLKEIYDSIPEEWMDDAEFLFFLGFATWQVYFYFGLNSEDESRAMLKKASILEPENTLFSWGFNYWTKPVSDTLEQKKAQTQKLIDCESPKMEWLKSKGLAGQYVHGHIEYAYEEYYG